MQIIPVLDVRGGVVVRAVAGRRCEYLPLVSRLTNSTEPLVVAEAIRARFGWTQFYIADLDAIERSAHGLAPHDYERFCDAGFSLWVDAGIRTAGHAQEIADHVDGVIVGLETLHTLADLREIVLQLGPERVVFSLDLRDGKPMCRREAWDAADPLAIAERVVMAGCARMIVLDVARVGVGEGIGTEELCRELLRLHPQLEVFVGGGMRDWDDVRRVEAIGVAGILVSSALHNGKLA